MRNDSIVYEKSFKFAKRIIKLYKFLVYEKKERRKKTIQQSQ